MGVVVGNLVALRGVPTLLVEGGTIVGNSGGTIMAEKGVLVCLKRGCPRGEEGEPRGEKGVTLYIVRQDGFRSWVLIPGRTILHKYWSPLSAGLEAVPEPFFLCNKKRKMSCAATSFVSRTTPRSITSYVR